MRSPVTAMLAAVVSLCLASPAQAAPRLEDVSIRTGDVFDLSPFAFQASYASAVTLTAARIVDQDGAVSKVAVETATRGRLIAVDLPVLPPHAYRLEWQVREATGEETRHAVAFVVRGCEEARPSAFTRAKP